MGALAQDLRYALRQMRKNPGFTAVAIVTLALSIGATTAIFSVVYGVLLRPLPYNDPDRIMAIFEVTTKGTRNRLADPNFDDFRDQSRSFQGMAKYSAYIAPVAGASQPSRSMVAHISPDFFSIFRVQPIIGRDLTTGQVRPALLVLLGAVGFLLLVAFANVANLLLAQASAREHELAIRGALGAARGRLLRQFLAEASLLVFLGGALGVMGAFWGVSALLALAPANLPLSGGVSVNLPVLGFALLLSAAVAIGLGAFTALRATSGNLRSELEEGSRGQAGSRSHRIGRTIVAAQIAITVVLVMGAGLLGRSLMKVLDVDPGFRVDKIVTMDVALPWPDWN